MVAANQEAGVPAATILAVMVTVMVADMETAMVQPRAPPDAMSHVVMAAMEAMEAMEAMGVMEAMGATAQDRATLIPDGDVAGKPRRNISRTWREVDDLLNTTTQDSKKC